MNNYNMKKENKQTVFFFFFKVLKNMTTVNLSLISITFNFKVKIRSRTTDQKNALAPYCWNYFRISP